MLLICIISEEPLSIKEQNPRGFSKQLHYHNISIVLSFPKHYTISNCPRSPQAPRFSHLIMKLFSTSNVAAAALLSASLAAADLDLTACSVSHNSGNGGNQFTMTWDGTPSQSQSTICGHFSDQVQAFILANGMQLKGSVSCSTSGSTISTQLTINKQSCIAEADVIGQAMASAIGSATTVNFDGSLCGNPDC